MDNLIAEGVKVDAVITDPPYGTTACKWDSAIPFDAMWERLKKLRNDNAPIVLFGSQPFTSLLIVSNLREFKYEWIWVKNIGSNFASVKYQPFKEHENVLVFGNKRVNYYPVLEKRKPSGLKRCKSSPIKSNTTGSEITGMGKFNKAIKRGELRYPRSIQEFNVERGLHPTQKPVELMEYLIKTYTNEGDTVLDFTMGSGSTGVACVNTNRKFIGIELDENYFKIAKKRIEEVRNES